MRDLPAPPRPQLHFHHFREEASVKTRGTGSGCFVVIRFPLQKTIENDISCSNIIKFQESLAKNKVKCTSPRPPRAHVEILPNTQWFPQFQDAMSRKHMKTHHFLIQKCWKSAPARMLNPSKTIVFLTFLSNGALRATFALTSNCFNNVCAPARATIPYKKWHKVHIAAAAARACRNPSKHTVISTISRCDVNKTYENVWLSHLKNLKIHLRRRRRRTHAPV